MPLGRELHAEVIVDSPDDDLARVEPDADLDRHAVLGADLARERAGGLTQMERRVAGAPCVIPVGDRRAEERHAAVPGELVNEALKARLVDDFQARLRRIVRLYIGTGARAKVRSAPEPYLEGA